MTPVRNEAWVLKAFLDATSRWADYIIIADQMSTDGSREIAKAYPKVILMDNKNPEFNEPERQAMLVAKAREVAAGRDTLLWGLDADEVLSANFMDTEDWQRILHSVPGDVFWFKWAEICSNRKEYWLSPYYPWLFHDDGREPHKNYVRKMHSMRIPYPIEEKQMYYVDDFRVLHLAYLNDYRVEAKSRFYQFVDWELNRRSPIALSRQYRIPGGEKDEKAEPISEKWLSKEPDIFALLDLTGRVFWYDDYIIPHMEREKTAAIRRLDIWDEVFLSRGIKDPRRWIDRIVHQYLKWTQSKKDTLFVRCIDWVLRWVY